MSNGWARVRSVGIAAVSVAVTAVNSSAQTGMLQGRVTDARDAALVGVTVTAESPAIAAPFVAFTDATGTYRLSTIPAGNYTVDFTLVGFRDVHRTVTLRNDTSVTLNERMVLAALTEQVDVVAVTPLLGTGISRDLLPAAVSVVGSGELRARGAVSVADALNERLGSVSLESTTANLFQPTLRFRGFTASPLLGLPQGIAVYQNGVRVNEPFGDTVQFDLMPMFAVSQMQLSAGTNPTYGLNALGGALALRLKSGFDLSGFQGEFSGGSFDRFSGTAEYGVNRGAWAFYAGATRFDETGWRVASPSAVSQAVADVAYRHGRVDAGINATYANTRLNGNSASPIDLLAVDRSAVFTYPDTTENELAFLQGRFNLTATETWSVQITGYYRDLTRQTLNGDEADFVVCDADSLPLSAPGDTLCLPPPGADDDDANALTTAPGSTEDGDGADVDDESEERPLVDTRTGRFITEADTAGNAAFNRTDTATRGYGATVQATAAGALGNHDHVLTLGASADLADVGFSSNSEIGALTQDRTVIGSGLFAGIFGEAPDDLFSTDLNTQNRAVGLYFSDTLSMSERFHATISGRFNHARINILDNLGSSLNGEHAYSRFNPSIGAVFQANRTVSLFARYSESNRVPTAAELSCADPAEPCRVPNAFVSDPPLHQATARSLEGGMRGNWVGTRSNLEWSASVYQTDIQDDILFVASPELIGTGFFQNAGDTRRAGLDAELRGQIGRVNWYASYALVEATFKSPLELPGNDEVNDAANDEGVLEVRPGDRLPGIPKHNFKTGVGMGLTDAWDLTIEAITVSSRVFVGDEGNDQLPVAGYGLASLRSSYRLHESVELFARIDNLFNADYETFGVLAELELDLEEAPGAEDPRFLSPGSPRSAFVGIRVNF